MKSLNEKIMIGIFAVSVIGFLIAPCCWTKSINKADKGIVSCSGIKPVPYDSLRQKNNMAINDTKIIGH